MISDIGSVHPFAGWDIAALIEARARQRGAHPALIWAPFDGPVRAWSYAELADAVARIAGGLAARGIAAGARAHHCGAASARRDHSAEPRRTGGAGGWRS